MGWRFDTGTEGGRVIPAAVDVIFSRSSGENLPRKNHFFWDAVKRWVVPIFNEL